MAIKYEATIKPADGKLIAVERAAARNAGSFTIKQEDVTSWRATLKNRGAYGSVKARYLDRVTSKEMTVTSGQVGYALPVF